MKSQPGLVAAALFWVLSTPLPAIAADGKAVWAAHCQACHGPDGSGDTVVGKALKVPDLAAEHAASISMITTTIKAGEGHMPKLGNQLSAAEIAAVARYTQQLMAAK